MMTLHRRFVVGLITVVAAMTFFAIYYAQRPAYNWDMIAYIAVALMDIGVPAATVHQKTYDALMDVPEKARKPLLESGEYRINVAKDPLKFRAQLPFYSVKPLYPALMSILYRAGIGLVTASIIVPVAAAMFHFASPHASGMMAVAAVSPHDRAQPVATGLSFPRPMEPVGDD